MPDTSLAKIDSGNKPRGSIAVVTLILCALMLTACSAVPKLYITSGGLSMEITRNAPYVTAVDFAPDGKSMVTGGADGTIRRWDLSGETMKFDGKTGWVAALSYSPDGKDIASISIDGIMPLTGIWSNSAIRFWNVETGRELKKISGFGGGGGADRDQNVQYLPDGKHILYTGPLKGSVHEIETGKKVFKDFGPKNMRDSVISPDGKAILMPDDHVAFKGRLAVALKDLTTGDLIWKTATDRSVDGVGFTANGNQIVSVNSQIVSGNETITGLMLLDATTGNIVKEFPTITHKGSWLNHVIDSFKLSPDGRFVLIGDYGGNYRLWDMATGMPVRQLTIEEKGDTSTVLLIRSAASFSPDSKTAVIASRASTRLVDVLTGKEIVTMISFEDGEWLVITSEGYYNSSDKGAQYLNVIAGDTKYSVDQFYDVFYRPDIVAAKLRGEDIKDLITITMKEAIKSPPPTVEIATIKDSNSSRIKICYTANSAGGGIGEIRLFHNGKLIQSDGYYKEMARSTAGEMQLTALNSRSIYSDMRGLSAKEKNGSSLISTKPKGELIEECKEIDAVPGENSISLAAFNRNNTVQSYLKTVSFNARIKEEEPHLYILSVGIDRYLDSSVSLKYAAKDATDIEQKLLKQAATLYKPENIHHELLTDDRAGKQDIIARIDALSRRIGPGDGFILFVAGHGLLLQNQYYMLTHDFNGQMNTNSMISSNEIVEMSKKIKSLSQLFIFDTCHAGGIDAIVNGLYDARMSVLAKKMGLHIYASASDKQSALDGYKGNGLFTYVLLDGLNNNREADKNKEGRVTVEGLGEYSQKTTTKISKEIGHSQTPLIIKYGKDRPIYKLR